MISIDERLAIHDLYAEYASAIDEFRLDDWLELFVESSRYQIVPRDNYDRGLPLALMLCESKDMLRDRVVALQQANEYDIHTDRHLVSGLRFRGRDEALVRVEADFAVFRCNSEGEASVNAVGRYIDRLLIEGGRARFEDKTVVLDNFCVPHAISTPL
jgi:3-phenylpropionate/cinnamic acid dioxygenase small subunit